MNKRIDELVAKVATLESLVDGIAVQLDSVRRIATSKYYVNSQRYTYIDRVVRDSNGETYVLRGTPTTNPAPPCMRPGDTLIVDVMVTGSGSVMMR